MRSLATTPLVDRVHAELATRRARMLSLSAARFERRDPRFDAVVGPRPRLEQLALTDAHEGPVYAPDEHALYFTSMPRRGAAGPVVDIRRLDLLTRALTVVRRDAAVANGMCLEPDGRLLVCEQGTMERPARIARVDPRGGDAETVVDAHEGAPLNSPNDVVVRSDGSIWFTDPSYGFLQGFRPPPAAGDHVYRYDPRTQATAIVADWLDKPNGLAFSPDESILYVADNGAPHVLLAFAVHGDRLGHASVVAFAQPGHPDGLKVDADGRVYASSPDGVEVRDRDGSLLGLIRLPGAVNFAFGGPGRNVLFVTTDTAIWAATLRAKGA